MFNAPEGLGPGEVHLWSVLPEEVTDPDLLAACLQVLDDDERAQQQRFVRPQDRHLYLVTHAATRACLARYLPARAEELRFVRNRHGRPELAGAASPRLRFNLAHTRGLATIAVAWERDLGVDVEEVGRAVDLEELARRFYAEEEARELFALPAAEQPRRFFQLWTLKEAYLKARGVGLSLPLRDLALQVHEDRVSARFAASLGEDPACWQLELLPAPPTHQAALAVRVTPGEAPLAIAQRGSPLA